MRKKIIWFLPLAFCFVLSGCVKDKLLHTYSIWTPVYKSKMEVFSDIKSNAPRTIENPGKIFLYGNYIFLSDVDKGIHIIDNTDPSHPVQKAFLNIPGSIDLAVKGNTLYTDVYTDLAVIDITDPLQARFIRYFNNIFPERVYPYGFVADTNRVLVGWNRKDTVAKEQIYYSSRNYIMTLGPQLMSGGGCPSCSSAPVFLSGSTARFAILNDYLYTVNRTALTPFNLSNSSAPVKATTRTFSWNIETIYPFGTKLFIGSQTGMYTFDVGANPAAPQMIGQFAHARHCDPVVADGNFAFVTLRSGNNCGDNVNELDVIDVTNVASATLVKKYALTNPYGLSKDQNLLFVCDGKAGLKMFDASVPSNLVLKNEYTAVEPSDVIAYNNNLIMVAKDGLYQFSYSFPSTLSFRSKISVNK